MYACTPIRHKFHPIPGHIRPQCPRSLAPLDRFPHHRGHKLDVYLDVVDDIQVGVDSGEQRRLAREVPRGRDGNPVKHVRNIEGVEIEAAARDTYRLVLTMERCERVGDVVKVYVRTAEVLGCEMGRFVRRCRGEDLCSWVMNQGQRGKQEREVIVIGGDEEQDVPSMGSCSGGSTRSSVSTSGNSISR